MIVRLSSDCGPDDAGPSQKCLQSAIFAPYGRAACRGGRVPQEPQYLAPFPCLGAGGGGEGVHEGAADAFWEMTQTLSGHQ